MGFPGGAWKLFGGGGDRCGRAWPFPHVEEESSDNEAKLGFFFFKADISGWLLIAPPHLRTTFEMETWCLMTNVSGKPQLSGLIYGEPFITAFHLEASFWRRAGCSRKPARFHLSPPPPPPAARLHD